MNAEWRRKNREKANEYQRNYYKRKREAEAQKIRDAEAQRKALNNSPESDSSQD